jgi:hypothetical protein
MGDARCNGSAPANYSAVMSDTVRGDVHELTLRLFPGSPAGGRRHACDCTTVVRPFGRRKGAPATAGKVTNRQHLGGSSSWCGRQRSPRARRAPGRYQRSPRSRLPEKSDAHNQKDRPGVHAGLRQRPSRSGRRHSVRHRQLAPPPRHLPPAVYRDRPRSSLQRTPISQVTAVLLPGHRALREISVVAISGPALTACPGGRASCRSPRAPTHIDRRQLS